MTTAGTLLTVKCNKLVANTTKPVKAKTSKPTLTKAEKDAAKAAKAAKKKVTTKKVAAPREVSPSVIDIDVDEPAPAAEMKKRPGIAGMVPATAIVEEPTAEVDEPAPVAPRGLADAIARARSIKQEQAKTPRQLAQEKAGVRKI